MQRQGAVWGQWGSWGGYMSVCVCTNAGDLCHWAEASCLRSVNFSGKWFSRCDSVDTSISLLPCHYTGNEVWLGQQPAWGITSVWHDLRAGGPKPTCLIQGQCVSPILEQRGQGTAALYIHLLPLYSLAIPRVQGVNPASGRPAILEAILCNGIIKNSIVLLAVRRIVNFPGVYTAPQIQWFMFKSWAEAVYLTSSYWVWK